MKKGFTLVEVIISIGILLLIGGTFFSTIKINQKKNLDKLDSMTQEIYTAINLLVETDETTKKQVYENKNGALIPLSKLQSEGLIDFGDININDQYVLTLLGDSVESEKCSGNLYNIGTWTKNEDDVIYICASVSTTTDNVKQELIINDSSYVAKGSNPNNWVVFPVNSDETNAAYFPNDEDKDLWRIISIDKDNNIKLIYNKTVSTNNDIIYNKEVYTTYDGDQYFKIKTNYFTTNFYDSYYYRSSKNDGFIIGEVLSEDKGKKKELLDSIDTKYIKNSDYYLKYSITGYYPDTYSAYPQGSSNLYMGLLTYQEYQDSYAANETWITYNQMIGYADHMDYGIMNILMNDTTQAQWKAFKTYKSGSSAKIGVNFAPYQPVVVLNDKVELVKDESCSQSVSPGSKECPYKLKCDEC